MEGGEIRVYTTCPQSKDFSLPAYAERVAEVARWSDDALCKGILVYTDNGLVDPWLVAQLIIQNTNSLRPLVAVQPIYMHPYAAAKMVASIAHIHGRAVDVNLVAGGFVNDLLSLGDEEAHGARYRRLVEYARVMTGLLTSPDPFTFAGAYYRVTNLRMRPAIPAELLPDFLVSGSSSAGAAAAQMVGATAVKYPQPAMEEVTLDESASVRLGIRVGIIARDSDEEAWALARERFPADRKGQITHRLAMKVSDSEWHKQLSQREDNSEPRDDPYWLWPFQNYRTFCPYLVGSYDRVAEQIVAYLERGFTTFILDIPPSREELSHTDLVFRRALSTQPA